MKEPLKRIIVYLDEKKFKKFREYCFYNDKSMSYVLNRFIEVALNIDIEKEK